MFDKDVNELDGVLVQLTALEAVGVSIRDSQEYNLDTAHRYALAVESSEPLDAYFSGAYRGSGTVAALEGLGERIVKAIQSAILAFLQVIRKAIQWFLGETPAGDSASVKVEDVEKVEEKVEQLVEGPFSQALGKQELAKRMKHAADSGLARQYTQKLSGIQLDIIEHGHYSRAVEALMHSFKSLDIVSDLYAFVEQSKRYYERGQASDLEAVSQSIAARRKDFTAVMALVEEVQRARAVSETTATPLNSNIKRIAHNLQERTIVNVFMGVAKLNEDIVKVLGTVQKNAIAFQRSVEIDGLGVDPTARAHAQTHLQHLKEFVSDVNKLGKAQREISDYIHAISRTADVCKQYYTALLEAIEHDPSLTASDIAEVKQVLELL